MKPPKKTILSKRGIELTPQEKNQALTAENLKMQRKIAKDYATIVSLKNENRVLKKENERFHSSILSGDSALDGIASGLLDKMRK